MARSSDLRLLLFRLSIRPDDMNGGFPLRKDAGLATCSDISIRDFLIRSRLAWLPAITSFLESELDLAGAARSSSGKENKQLMINQNTPEIEMLRAAYAAFNARDINSALALMTPDVSWPRAFKGGFVRGPEEIRAYWTEQWREIDGRVEPIAFYPADDARILVEVHQVVRDLAGALLADEKVGHCFTFFHGLIHGMEVVSLSTAEQSA